MAPGLDRESFRTGAPPVSRCSGRSADAIIQRWPNRLCVWQAGTVRILAGNSSIVRAAQRRYRPHVSQDFSEELDHSRRVSRMPAVVHVVSERIGLAQDLVLGFED